MAINESDLKILRLRLRLLDSIRASERQLKFEAVSQAKRLYDSVIGTKAVNNMVTISEADYQKLMNYLKCMSTERLQDLPDRSYLVAYYDKINSDQDILNQL